MRTYDHMVELARVCARNAHVAGTPALASDFWKMAQVYQRKAAERVGGKFPDIGPGPDYGQILERLSECRARTGLCAAKLKEQRELVAMMERDGTNSTIAREVLSALELSLRANIRELEARLAEAETLISEE